MDKIKILFLISATRMNKKGLVPLICRITFDKRRKPFSTGIFINPKNWNSSRQKAIPDNVENNQINTPPYLSTDTSSYKMDYWRIGDYLDILNLLDDKPYFYFTSEKSQIIELAQWMSENGFKKSPFDKATIKIVHTSLNHTAKYNDIMIFKNQTDN